MTLARLIAQTFQTPAGGPSCAPAIVPRPHPATTFGASRPARQHYERARDLPLLLPLWPDELADETQEGRARIIAKLQHALRRERRNGINGHWTYNLARHEALLTALRHERRRAFPVAAQRSSDVAATSAHVCPDPHPRTSATRLAEPGTIERGGETAQQTFTGDGRAQSDAAAVSSALPAFGSGGHSATPITVEGPVSAPAHDRTPTITRTIHTTGRREGRGRSFGRLGFGRRAEALLSASSRAPFSSRAESAQPRSSVPPSGSSVAGPTSPGIGPATTCNGS